MAKKKGKSPKKSRVWAWTKRKTKSRWKKMRANHKRNVADRKKVRKQAKAVDPTYKETGSFWARHPWMADLRDGVTVSLHAQLDKRDLRQGLITEDELAELDKFDSTEEWRQEMAKRRRERMKTDAARRRDEDTRAPLTLVVARNGAKPAVVKHVGFRPPAPRSKPQTGTPPAWKPPAPRVVRRPRRDRVASLAKAWGPKIEENARKSMAADADLTGAIAALNSFAESFPETRTQIHDHLGKLAEFGKSYSAAMETFKATLERGTGEDNPGLPPEVTQHLAPLADVGATINAAAVATIAAWEDYFQAAIQVAKDEHTPSKAALLG
jgi:hypothetical protein